MRIGRRNVISGLCCCAAILSAFLYAVAFYTTISFVDSIGIRGLDSRFEQFIVFSSFAHLLAAIVVSVTIFMDYAIIKFVHLFLQVACWLLVSFSLMGTYAARDHIMIVIRDGVMRSKRIQKQNSCCNWDGRNSFLEHLTCPYRRLCGPVFRAYYDRRASSNVLLLSIAFVASTAAVILAGVIYYRTQEGVQASDAHTGSDEL
jgi:hypothetical protein